MLNIFDVEHRSYPAARRTAAPSFARPYARVAQTVVTSIAAVERIDPAAPFEGE
jgi:hypothetical protein